MSDKHTGCYTIYCSKARYFHCFSHQLNLCIQHGLQIDHVRSMLHQISGITNYFRQSEPHRRCFGQHILREKENHIIYTNKTELFDVCRTRWVAPIEGLITFFELIRPKTLCL